ncbi:undecaprenyl-phosphate alpha-N-acetylglucosaminyl 1-phosphate transferase [Vibrio astriarenae]|uniref:Undecaprenyl-phosphate alpha-N-acetylglucosaminyl 1-phosphate transferase n=1 Tax=Vibrio astriarenae TaxID=1481923 RepID=A0A7Z2T552_9VIBR|nr:undecaprenyl-phosphate alpha-N-acetylglucosaminyl 1-phosphate transferase [Vibrio astriarenae]QIA64435.1 undecaprenyl-phosphate alpha-N-acetylglucosaminyl 1-phosphate transferase [Vibrio astriarenae]
MYIYSLSMIAVFCLVNVALIQLLAKQARRVGLVDRRSTEQYPLIGGVCFFAATVGLLSTLEPLLPFQSQYIFCVTVLICLGVIDDRFDISYRYRLIIQSFLAGIMIFGLNIKITELGDLIAIGDITLLYTSHIVTLLAILGAINAFNMIDGVDGLLITQSIITLVAIGIGFTLSGNYQEMVFCFATSAILLPCLRANIGRWGQKRKIFMGDAGSTLIGFTIIWLLIEATTQESGQSSIRTVTALWLIAVPLMDMAHVILYRIKLERSPFKPDYNHLHHTLIGLGLSEAKTRTTMSLIGIYAAGFGLWGEITHIPEAVMFFVFLMAFALFCAFKHYALRRVSRNCRGR